MITESMLDGFALSPQQELALRNADDALAVVQCALLLESPADPDEVRRALERIIDRHEILRTTFVRAHGVSTFAAQKIHDELRPDWRAERRDDDRLLRDRLTLDALLVTEAGGGLDAESGPTLRALLVELPGAGSLLVLTAIAAIVDRESLLTVAAGLGDGGVPEPLQYADYAAWRNELLGGQESASEQPEANESVAVSSLLFGSPPQVGRQPACVAVELGGQVQELLAATADAMRATPALLVEAACHALVSRLAGESAIALGSEVDGRSQPELAGAVGPYAQVVPIRTRADEKTSFSEIVDQVRRARLEAARLQDQLTKAQLEDGAARLAISFSAPHSTGRVLTAGRFPVSGLELVWLGDGGELWFDSSGYDRTDAERIASQLSVLVQSALADPAQPVERLPLLDEKGREHVLSLGEGPRRATTPATFHELFERQAARSPDLVGVRGAGEALTYRELNERANRLAHRLRSLGIDRGDAVGLCTDRTPPMLVALLGIMKAGAGYLPLNFEHPAARLAHQLTEAEAKAVVTQEALLERLPNLETEHVVCLDRDEALVADLPASNPDSGAEPSDLAYVMYTSGSTGLPKGVAVTHANIVGYAEAIAERLEANEGMQFAVVSAVSTDLGNTALFPPLLSGGCVHLIDPGVAMDGDAFAGYATAYPIDVLKITPTHLTALLSSGGQVLPRRWLVVGGEAFSWRLVEQLREAGAACRILNHYGPTETTVGCCSLEVTNAVVPGKPATVPIGRPLPNVEVRILDRSLEPVPIGVAGELFVGGAGVASGYVNRPDETASRFIEVGGSRLYRTGDRVRFLPDGNIEFLGRIDEQVKIRGFRVEPGEVEAALLAHPDVRGAAVVAWAEADGDPRLVAYLVASPQPHPADLHAFLAESLPEFMIPSLYEPIDMLPLTASGKTDRRALPEPGASRGGAEYVAPRDELEEEVAEIWAELLGVEQVGIFDDFFALGGHSLLATQAIIRIRRGHGNVPLGALFTSPTVAALAEAIRETQVAQVSTDRSGAS